MFTIIKNLILGYKVCKKFNVKFIPWRRVKYSCASFQVVDGKDYTIWCEVNNKMFIPSLFHELSHCIDYKHTKMKRKSSAVLDVEKIKSELDLSEEDYKRTLESEVRANRYALKFLKSTGMWCQDYQDDLEWAMTTYIKYVDKLSIADYHYNTMKYLRGNL